MGPLETVEFGNGYGTEVRGVSVEDAVLREPVDLPNVVALSTVFGTGVG